LAGRKNPKRSPAIAAPGFLFWQWTMIGKFGVHKKVWSLALLQAYKKNIFLCHFDIVPLFLGEPRSSRRGNPLAGWENAHLHFQHVQVSAEEHRLR
jgi:hypothetical protein